jgi:hypothetical protein
MAMTARHLKALSILTGTAICFADLPPVPAEDARAPAAEKAQLDGDQLAIASLIPKFQALGLRREQAEMLAEQTAGFGTLGLLISAAAIGVGSRQANRVIGQSEGQINAVEATGLLLTARIGSCESPSAGPRAVRAHDGAGRSVAGGV